MDSVIFPGTLELALRSNIVLPGSRILLRGGNYTIGNLTCLISDVTITNYPGEQAVIIPSGYRSILFQDVHDIVMDGLIVDGSHLSNECIKITGSSRNIQITNCEIRNGGTHGILMTGAIHDCEIDNCNIHNNGNNQLDHGIYIDSQHAGQVVTIHHNTITNNASNGVHAYGGSVAAAYQVHNNYLDSNGRVGIGLYSGVSQIYNNVIRNTVQRGITLRYDLVQTLVAFNTIVDSLDNIEISQLYNDSPSITIQNNLLGGTGNVIENTSGKAITESNNLYDNSLVDNGGAMIKPDIESVAKGGGLVVNGIIDDYGGNVRANPPTIGAWE